MRPVSVQGRCLQGNDTFTGDSFESVELEASTFGDRQSARYTNKDLGPDTDCVTWLRPGKELPNANAMGRDNAVPAALPMSSRPPSLLIDEQPISGQTQSCVLGTPVPPQTDDTYVPIEDPQGTAQTPERANVTLLPDKSKPDGRRTGCKLIYAILVALLMLTVLGGIYVIRTESRAADEQARKEAGWCLPCRDLGVEEYDFTEKFSRKISRAEGATFEECCVHPSNPEEVILFIKMLTQREVLKNSQIQLPSPLRSTPQGQGSKSRKFISLYFARSPLKLDNDKESRDFQTVREWTAEGDRSFQYSGIYLNRSTGAIRIRYPGIYLLSSRVSFRMPASVSDTSLTFYHRIKSMKSDGSFGVIQAQDVHEKRCVRQEDSSASVSCHTSTIVIPIRVHTNDEIRVLVTNKHLLQLEKWSTFLSISRRY